MRDSLIFILTIILLSSYTLAYNVTLVNPENNAIFTNPDFINFKCSSDIPNMIQLQLHSNIDGEWRKLTQKDGSLIKNEIYQFSLFKSSTKFNSGKFEWNCRAVSESEGVLWSPRNKTLEIQILNDPPICNSTFPQITLQKNTPQSNVLNLNNYIIDPNKDQLNFSFSGNNNVDITLKDNGFIDLSPQQERIAKDNIYIRANDGKGSDVQCGPLTVNIISTGPPPQNTTNTTTTTNIPPKINPQIPDQTKEDGVSYWEIDLDDYAEDDNSKAELNWTIENIGTDVVKITINQINHKVKFEPLGKGTDTIAFVVTDPKGLFDDQDVKITITSQNQDTTQETDDQNQDEENLKEELGVIKIISHVPGSSDPKIETGSSLQFSVIVNEQDYEILWFVDGNQVKEGDTNFTFMPEEAKKYKISVLVSKNGKDDNYEWEVDTIEKINETLDLAQTPCGNLIIDENETCSSCPEDVICKDNEECINDKCIIKQQENKITGLGIKNLNTTSKIGMGAIGVVIILFVLIMIIRAKNKRKSKDRKLSSFEPKIKEVKPKTEHVLKTIEQHHVPQGVEHIIGFIQSGLASGDSPRKIKKALATAGWNRRQIRQSFKSIKK